MAQRGILTLTWWFSKQKGWIPKGYTRQEWSCNSFAWIHSFCGFSTFFFCWSIAPCLLGNPEIPIWPLCISRWVTKPVRLFTTNYMASLGIWRLPQFRATKVSKSLDSLDQNFGIEVHGFWDHFKKPFFHLSIEHPSCVVQAYQPSLQIISTGEVWGGPCGEKAKFTKMDKTLNNNGDMSSRLWGMWYTHTYICPHNPYSRQYNNRDILIYFIDPFVNWGTDLRASDDASSHRSCCLSSGNRWIQGCGASATF